MERLLTAEEIAEAMQVSIKTVRAWTRKGLLRAQFAGKRTVRYRQSDVDAFLSQRAQKAV